MTREEAIAILEVSKYMATSGRMYDKAIDMAIEALSAEATKRLKGKDAKIIVIDASAEAKGANLINRHDATTVIREECWKCNRLINADLLGRILALPTSRQTDCTEFIEWLIEIILDDEDWELNAVAYGEIIARKLKKLGLLEVKDGYYIRPSAEAELVLQTPQTYGKSINPSNAEVVADYISRADAIEAVAQEWLSEASAESPYVNDDDIGEYRKLAEELFEDIPSAEAVQGEWIPCSERLPKARESVILSTKEWTGEGCYWETTKHHVIWKGYRWNATYWDDEVIAWMPLPKPYREDGEEE